MNFVNLVIVPIFVSIITGLILSLLGADKLDVYRIIAKENFEISADKSELYHNNIEKRYITKFYVKNNFSKNAITTKNNKTLPYIDISNIDSKVLDFYLSENTTSFKPDVKLNMQDNKIFFSFDNFNFNDEFYIFLVTDKSIDLSELRFRANLNSIKSEQYIQVNDLTFIQKYINVFIILLLCFVLFLYLRLIKQCKSLKESFQTLQNEKNSQKSQLESSFLVIQRKKTENDENKKEYENTKNTLQNEIINLKNSIKNNENELAICKIIIEEDSSSKEKYSRYKMQFDQIEKGKQS